MRVVVLGRRGVRRSEVEGMGGILAVELDWFCCDGFRGGSGRQVSNRPID